MLPKETFDQCVTSEVASFFPKLIRYDFTDETPCKQEACASFSDKLPEPHRSLFLWLAALLVEVAKNHHINKMTPGNLGTPFPPLTDLLFFFRIMHNAHLSIAVEQRS